jgi:hypothetical protein
MICATISATTAAAWAEGSSAPQGKGALPGVDGNYRIVKPATPEPDDQSSDVSGGQFKIGNMDVRIGGSVTVDIGAGSLPHSHR